MDPIPDTNAAAAASQAIRAFIEANGLIGDALVAEVMSDENGRRFAPRVELGQLSDDAADAASYKTHLDFAQRKLPSQRWQTLLRRRSAQLRARIAAAIETFVAAQRRDPAARPGIAVAECVRQLDAEIAALDRRQAQALASLRALDEPLKVAQAELEAELNPRPSGAIFGRMLDVALTFVQTLGRGVGLAAKVMAAERLVNDREEYAFLYDAAAAALAMLQEARAQAQAELDHIRQLAVRLAAARQRLAARAAALAPRLGAHPYAQVDVTRPEQVRQLSAGVRAPALDPDLGAHLGLDAEQLEAGAVAHAEAIARAGLAGLSLMHVMEIEAAMMRGAGDAPVADGEADLVLGTLQTADQRARAATVRLCADAGGRAWALVGVEDETNPGFAFGQAALVSLRRRDQIRFLYVRTGLRLADLEGYGEMQAGLEEASKRRNYFVLPALTRDDPSRRLFALGLAHGLIALREGAFVVQPPGADQPVTLGITADAAVAAFADRAEMHPAIEAAVRAVPTQRAVVQLERALDQVQSGGEDDDLWHEMAGHLARQLAIVRQQARYVAVSASVEA